MYVHDANRMHKDIYTHTYMYIHTFIYTCRRAVFFLNTNRIVSVMEHSNCLFLSV